MQKKNEKTEVSSFIGEKTAGLSYTAFACIFFFVSLVIGMLPRTGTPQWFLYASYLASPVAFLLVSVWYFYYTKQPLRSFFQAQKCKPKYYLIAIILQIGLLSLGELNALFLKLLQGVGYEDSGILLPKMEGVGFVGVFLTIAVLPAIMEELFFRGVFMRGMKNFSTWGRVLLCGGLFALYHQNPAQTVYQFICGAAFALVAVRSGSFFPTVLSHFINNGVILILTKLGVEGYPTPVYVAILVVSGICLVGSLAYLIGFDRKKQEKKREKASYRMFFAYAALGIAVFALSWLLTLVVGL